MAFHFSSKSFFSTHTKSQKTIIIFTGCAEDIYGFSLHKHKTSTTPFELPTGRTTINQQRKRNPDGVVYINMNTIPSP